MPTARAGREWLERFARRIEDVLRDGGAEATHDLRTAAARLDVQLRMCGLEVLRDDLRRVRRAAAEMREIDVCLEDQRSEPLRAWLLERHAAARNELARELSQDSTRALVEALGWLPLPRRAQARDWEAAQLERVRAQARAAARMSAPLDEIHSVRRSLRRLRYAREWLGRPTRTLRELQDELGSLNDVATLLAYALESPMAEQLAELRAELTREVAKRMRKAKAACRGAKLESKAPRR
jgi:CHAD domain-containing protein